jgi:hypothetical protein
VQDVLQQTLSTQFPNAHWFEAAQALPLLFFTTHVPPGPLQ